MTISIIITLRPKIQLVAICAPLSISKIEFSIRSSPQWVRGGGEEGGGKLQIIGNNLQNHTRRIRKPKIVTGLRVGSERTHRRQRRKHIRNEECLVDNVESTSETKNASSTTSKARPKWKMPRRQRRKHIRNEKRLVDSVESTFEVKECLVDNIDGILRNKRINLYIF